VNDYDLLRDYLKKQKLPEFVLSFEQIEEILDAALPRAAHRASWWETLRSPQEKMPQREACLWSRLSRDAAGGREEREVQENAGEAVSRAAHPSSPAHEAPRFRAGYWLVWSTPAARFLLESFSRHRPYRRLNLGRT
jgi:hypothetical protein